LATVARSIDLGKALQLGPSAGRSGGSDRASILADALEAVIAAVFLDAGFKISKEVTLSLFATEISNLKEGRIEKDPKTQLQELLQAGGATPPDYQVTSTSGQPHEREFVVECRIESHELVGTGRGSSRKEAEQVAASHALDELQRR
jgi:ribonuclease-3